MSHKIILIAAVDRNWAIGKNNRLLYRIPTDMQFFKQQTMGNIVVYGRRTLESFPGGRILSGRDNIVLTRKTVTCEDAHMYIAHCIDDVVHIINSFDDERPVFVCGGASVYEQFVHIADEAYITKISAETSDADAYFPNLKTPFLIHTDSSSGLDICFEHYVHSETFTPHSEGLS